MNIIHLKSISLAFALTLLGAFHSPFDVAQAQSIPITDQPLFTTAGVPPLMMMVMSRDEQLFNKAYTDYTDLAVAGVIDATYNNNFAYAGYFDSDLCYAYSSAVFKAAAAADNHQCSGRWSGNFLNWVTMSRLDMLRSVLYGGLRSTDTATQTILERAAIPNDLHAWAKVYGGSDIGSYAPLSGITTFCNATFYDNNGKPATPPSMRVAAGDFSQWATTERHQCVWQEDGLQVPTDGPKRASAGSADYTVRVEVCSETGGVPREAFCRKYINSNTGAAAYKPAGLLQQYGENGQMRFGLMTGSNANPRSGGRLRRNIGRFAGNGTDPAGCATGDEVKLSDGTFCNQTASYEGILNTLNRLQLVGWYGNGSPGSGDGWRATVNGQQDCWSWGTVQRTYTGYTNVNPGDANGVLDNPGGGNQPCNAWGNPLSEIYTEAVRYILGQGNPPTPGFVSGSDQNFIAGIPDQIDWIDPYGVAKTDGQHGNGGGNPYCAACSILVLSTGLNSFDSDEIPAISASFGTAAASTTKVGQNEGIHGNYLVGRVLGQNSSPSSLPIGAAIDTYSDVCTSKAVTDLATVIGICPDVPSLEGSYLMDGLAYKAWTTDLRPELRNSKGQAKPADAWNQVQTYTVALAENLPKFQIPVGSGISFSPLAMCNPGDNQPIHGSGYHTCALGGVSVGTKTSIAGRKYVYGRPLLADGSAGSYAIVWEDSTFGSDHDMDAVQVITYCVGDACKFTNGQAKLNTNGTTYAGYDICWRSDSAICIGSGGKPTVAANQVLMRVEILSTSTGDTVATGFSISGTSGADGATPVVRGWGNDSSTSVLTAQDNPPGQWDLPKVLSFTPGTSAARRLENPLWYAAKYGGFTKPDTTHPGKRRNPVAGEMPAAGDWETLDRNGQATDTPSNYFLVRDPGRLKHQLQHVFDSVLANSSPSGSVASSSSRFTVGQTLAYQSSYDSNNWVGDLKAFNLNSNGSLGNQAWAAAAALPSGARSDIWIGVAQNSTDATFTARKFTRSNMPAWMTTALTTAGTTPATWPNTSASTDSLIAYLSGDQSNELPAGSYRQRDPMNRMGDIVNSSPQVAHTLDYGYSQLQNPTGCAAPCTSSYAAFVTGKTNSTVFVGANDGMLHAFDGSATGGQELFSYIPNAVISKLGTLPKPGYVHTYFVDGTPAIGDAYLGNRWKTVLVASAGAGAPAVFALDVTHPSSFGTSSLLWEFNSKVDADMGQFTGIPSPPTLTSDGKWVTAFGNGYNGASNKAKLLVIDLSTGDQVSVAPITDSANAAPNGLSMATIIDAVGACASGPAVCPDGVGDTIYAGDYLGNIWKFVLSAAGTWQLTPSTPIFKAIDAHGHKQPITSGMYAIKNPLGGVIIYFGTGKHLTAHDNDPGYLQADGKPLVNTIYAVWDNGSGTPVTRSDLQQQKILSYTGTGGAFTITQNAFGYRTPVFPGGMMGWYLDLSVASANPDPLQSERVLASPTGLLGKLFVNMFRPIGDICVPAGVNSLLELDLLNGAAAFPSPGGGGNRSGNGSGSGGSDVGNGPPLGSPNPVVTIPGQTGIPAIGCPPGNPNCVAPHPWCTADVPGYPNCADPAWCQSSAPGYPNCPAPADCHPAIVGPPAQPASPGYPYCHAGSRCSLIPNAGTPIGHQAFQCRAAWRQLR
jgi:type IV pilus assembly protein PilY1